MDNRSIRLPSRLPLLCVTAAMLFFVLLAFVTVGAIAGADRSILVAIHTLATPWLDRTAIIVSNAASAPAITAAMVMLAAGLIKYRRRLAALRLFVTVWGAALTTTILKVLVTRPRPELWQSLVHESSWSFPSGHATASSALAGVIVLLFWRTSHRWLVLPIAGLFVVLVGLSRLYLGVHYPTDVLAGWCVGVMWATGTSIVLKRREP